MEAGGFAFDFGDHQDDSTQGADDSSIPAAAMTVDASATVMHAPLSLADVVNRYQTAFDAEGSVTLPLTTSTGASCTLCYQKAPRVPALEGDGKASRDIVPGKYLGGLKVWSCSADVARFIANSSDVSEKLQSESSCFLEVGCGQALPSLSAIVASRARCVVCHDYNGEVLELCTLPNIARTVAVNACMLSSSEINQRVQVAHGDWDMFFPRGEQVFDVIAGSDVTYDVEACQKLGRLLSRLLAPKGVAIIGTKEYYFGTNGGSTEAIEAIRRASADRMIIQCLPSGGTANELARVILTVSWK